MLLFKKIDVYGQILLIPAAFIWGCLNTHDLDFIYGYFIVGGWQVISMIIHQIVFQHMPTLKDRTRYQRLIVILLIIAVICFIEYISKIGGAFTFIYLFFLLFGSPVIAIWYMLMSYKELKIWTDRDAIHLK